MRASRHILYARPQVLRCTRFSPSIHIHKPSAVLPTPVYRISRPYAGKAFSPMKVFDRSVKKLQRARAARIPNSREFDYLRDGISLRLTDRIDDIQNKEFPRCLDLGAMAGHNLKNLQDRGGIKSITMLESSEEMLYRDVELDNQYEVKPIRVVGDEESLPFEDKTFDIIVSNLSLHWVNDLPKAFREIKRCLVDDGVFIGALLGENTLQELRSAFVLAEQEREGGVSPHVSPFTSVGDIGNMMTGTGFSLVTVDQEQLNVDYADPFVLMNDLRSMAENNAGILNLSLIVPLGLQRRAYTPRETIFAAASLYQSLYKNEDGTIPATYHVIWMIGWSPHSSQPQPKKRGSQTHSMKDIEKILAEDSSDPKDRPSESSSPPLQDEITFSFTSKNSPSDPPTPSPSGS